MDSIEASRFLNTSLGPVRHVSAGVGFIWTRARQAISQLSHCCEHVNSFGLVDQPGICDSSPISLLFLQKACQMYTGSSIIYPF